MANAKPNTNKVGGDDSAKDAKNTKDAEGKKKKKTHIDFPMKSAKYRDADGNVVTAVNAEGLLTAVPVPILDGEKVVYAGYDPRKYKPLKKSDFASMATYLQCQGFVARVRAARLIKIAENKEATAARLLKFGDEATRKKAVKVAKMREQLAALEKQLKADGVAVEDI